MITIRPITELADLARCVDLQRATWGLADIEVIPVRMLVTQNRVGGLVLGAFDDDQLIGFLNAMPGIREGKPYWYSQMLAVENEYRDRGIGADLKLAQRQHARERGIQLIEWTFDPLESKNAYLNIAKLGVIVRRYYVNLYGATASQVQQGLESDRLIAEWWIDQPRIAIQGDVRRIYIPVDIQALKKQSVKSAQAVQFRVREQFLKNFQDDYFVAGFERKDEWSEYLFIPGASRVHQAN
jgi:predicted GNAT superfamily acetyltransferase